MYTVGRAVRYGTVFLESLSRQHRVRMPSKFYQMDLLALAHVDIIQKLFAMPSEAVCAVHKMECHSHCSHVFHFRIVESLFIGIESIRTYNVSRVTHVQIQPATFARTSTAITYLRHFFFFCYIFIFLLVVFIPTINLSAMCTVCSNTYYLDIYYYYYY